MTTEGLICPLMRDICKRTNCVLWKDEKCLLVVYLNLCAEVRAIPAAEMVTEWTEPGLKLEPSGKEKEALTRLQQETAEQLAGELLAFAEKECLESKGGYGYLPHYVSQMFWRTKGLPNGYTDDQDTMLKMTRVEALARQRWYAETQEMQRKAEEKQTKEERETLPKLVEECVEWAKTNGLKKVTHNDLDYFLLQRDVSLSWSSRRALYTEVNFKLKK